VAATLVRLSPDRWPIDLLLRFGAVLPTTSHTSGLDRDRTDFFALAGARYRHGRLALRTEQGVGINGTVFSHYPQSDVWAYTAGVDVDVARPGGVPVRAVAEAVGHRDGHEWMVRGNEDQQEVRLGVDVGGSWLLRGRYLRGRTAHSPTSGWRISGGFLVGSRR
jgi:hypothetical protein